MAVAAKPQAVDLETIPDKVSITLGQQLYFQFTADGDRLLHPKEVKQAGDDKATVGIKLRVTDSTPIRVRGNATRPYLTVSNGLKGTLHYRALARNKGSKEFFEILDPLDPVAPGDVSTKCWESGSLIEEIVLYQFTLSPKPSK